jgi:ABC-type nitrate/sulfonate/bicarbonate transport system substrate-binding protein
MPLPVAVEAIKAGRIDGTILVDPFLLEALTPSGGARVLGHPSNAVAPTFAVTYYFCLRDYAQRNRDVIARFQRSIATATAYAKTHKSEMNPLVVEYTKMDPAIVAQTPFDIGSGLDPAMLQPVIDFAARYNFIKHPFPAAELSVPQLTTSG